MGRGLMLNLFAPSEAGDERLRRAWSRYERQAASPGTTIATVRLLYTSDVRALLPAIQVRHSTAPPVPCGQPRRSATMSPTCGLDIRSGLHTGEIELEATDIAGLAVHIAARILAMANPGEVLVSGTVKDLVVGSGLEFNDRGSHVLKGVPGEWRVFALA